MREFASLAQEFWESEVNYSSILVTYISGMLLGILLGVALLSGKPKGSYTEESVIFSESAKKIDMLKDKL